MNSALIMGANGFIGSRLCRLLLSKNIKVYAVVRSHESDISTLEDIIDNNNLTLSYCDMHNITSLTDELTGRNIDTLYFLSWQGITGAARSDYSLQVDNIKCLLDTISFAHTLNIKSFVGSGTLAEIDVNNYSSLDGSTPNPVSQYGAAKLSAHLMSKALCNQLGMNHIWAQIGNTFGEGDKSSNFVNFAINLIRSDNSKDFTAGEQFYDFVHVDDVAQGLYLLGQSGHNNYSYYIGSCSPRRLKDYIIAIRDEVNPTIALNLGAIPYNGVITPIETYDCNKIISDTGYKASVSFEEGLKRLLASYNH